MTTARDLIKSALRKIHVLGKGSSLDSEDASNALDTLNTMLSMWSAEGAMVYVNTRETFNLSTSASYTIGSGGDFNTARPIDIINMYVSDGGIDYTVLPISSSQYASISLKDISTPYPDYYYYDGGYPLGTIFLYPTPTGGTITISSIKALSSFTTLDTDFSLPEEYKAAIEYNLAVWLSGEYEREPTASVQRIANKSKEIVMAQNNKKEMWVGQIDLPSRNQSNQRNIYEGQN